MTRTTDPTSRSSLDGSPSGLDGAAPVEPEPLPRAASEGRPSSDGRRST